MSCESQFDKIAGIGGGVPRLASKTTAAIGLAAGLGMVAVLAVARRYARRAFGAERGTPVDARAMPALPARVTVMPTEAGKLTGGCATCGSTPGDKPGMWYVIRGQPHCQDCAPQAAREAGVDLSLPPGAPPPGAWRSGSRPPVTMIFPPGMYQVYSNRAQAIPLTTDGAAPQAGHHKGAPRGKILDVGQSVEVKRLRQRIKLTMDGMLRRNPVDADAYVVQTVEGADTGLAIVPRLVVDDGVRVDSTHWGIIHMESGKSLGGMCRFDHPVEAEGLASILAQLDWTRPLEDISPQEMADVDKTVRAYHQGLQLARGR